MGVIWMIQQVHYPLFGRVGAEGYGGYQQEHMQRISWIVMPVMVVEAITAAVLVIHAHDVGESSNTAYMPFGEAAALLNLAAVGLIWLSTALLQVPAHAQLLNGFERTAHIRLLRTN